MEHISSVSPGVGLDRFRSGRGGMVLVLSIGKEMARAWSLLERNIRHRLGTLKKQKTRRGFDPLQEPKEAGAEAWACSHPGVEEEGRA